MEQLFRAIYIVNRTLQFMKVEINNSKIAVKLLKTNNSFFFRQKYLI